VFWNSPSSRQLAGYGHTFLVEVVSPSPESLGLQAILLRAMVADAWSGDYIASRIAAAAPKGRSRPPSGLAPLGPSFSGSRVASRVPSSADG
jgi:hypothetical protein